MHVIFRFTCLLAAAASGTMASAQQAPSAKLNAPAIAVQLTIANPCINSHYENLQTCSGQMTRTVTERKEEVGTFSANNTLIHGDSETYRVLVTDFY